MNFDEIKDIEKKVLAICQERNKDLIILNYTFCNIMKIIIAILVELCLRDYNYQLFASRFFLPRTH